MIDDTAAAGGGGGGAPEQSDPYRTRPSIFGRIQATESGTREIAWREFCHRYTPIIRGFARNMGARSQDGEDIVQDVLTGFFGAQASFVYDSSKGRFRGYLKRATINAIRVRHRKRQLPTMGLEGIEPDELGAEDPRMKTLNDAWDAEWDKQMLDRAMEQVRGEYKDNKTFRCFEQYAILGLPAAEVAAKVGVSVESVYQAKTRVTESLKNAIDQIEALEP